MTKSIEEFHCHVYYSTETRESAQQLRTMMLHLAGGRLQLSSLSDGPRGPHVPPMFGISLEAKDLAEVVGFLMQNHGPHPVLLHPETGNDLLDHTIHAFWLGGVQELNLSIFKKIDQA